MRLSFGPLLEFELKTPFNKVRSDSALVPNESLTVWQ